MKKLRWVFVGLLLVSTFVFSENNQSVSDTNVGSILVDTIPSVTQNAIETQSTLDKKLEVINNLGDFISGILASYTGEIGNLIFMLSIIITVIISFLSFATYLKTKSLSDSIRENTEAIQKYKEVINKEFSEYKKEMKDEIVEEVKQQIVYGLDEALLNVQEHAYRKVEHTVDKLTEEIQRRRFFYQGLIYQINQAKKYEYEEVMKEEIELDEKIEKIIKVQAKYNEINNHDIPKLFSKNIEEDVVPRAIKLSGYKNIKHTVQKLLLKALKNDNLNFVEKTQIKDVLKEKYDWVEEKGSE